MFEEQGAQASLRDIARRAEVGLGTLYRHFPTRDALLDSLLGRHFDALAAQAADLAAAHPPREALTTWLRAFAAQAAAYQDLSAALMDTINDETSPLHASCATPRTPATSAPTSTASNSSPSSTPSPGSPGTPPPSPPAATTSSTSSSTASPPRRPGGERPARVGGPSEGQRVGGESRRVSSRPGADRTTSPARWNSVVSAVSRSVVCQVSTGRGPRSVGWGSTEASVQR